MSGSLGFLRLEEGHHLVGEHWVTRQQGSMERPLSSRCLVCRIMFRSPSEAGGWVGNQWCLFTELTALTPKPSPFSAFPLTVEHELRSSGASQAKFVYSGYFVVHRGRVPECHYESLYHEPTGCLDWSPEALSVRGAQCWGPILGLRWTCQQAALWAWCLDFSFFITEITFHQDSCSSIYNGGFFCLIFAVNTHLRIFLGRVEERGKNRNIDVRETY